MKSVPHFMEDYRSRTHVLPRMMPAMVALALTSVDPGDVSHAPAT